MHVFSFLKAFTGLLLTYLLACGQSPQPAHKEEGQFTDIPAGQQLMTTYCQACHALPQPKDLDQRTWQTYVLVRMSAYMGVFHDSRQYYDALPARWLEPGRGGERVLAAGIYPQQPMLSRTEWEQLSAYLLAEAPSETRGAGISGGGLQQPLPLFQARPLLAHSAYQPVVTGVAIDPFHQQIYVGYRDQALLKVSTKGEIREKVSGFTAPVHILPERDRLTVLDIGNMVGSDDPRGKWAEGATLSALSASSGPRNNLQRPVHVAYGDLDADGDEDVVLCEFGNQLGQLSWWEQMEPGRYKQHVLKAEDGATVARIADMNADGLPDITVMMANADEGVDVYVNQGSGRFVAHRVLRFVPNWGSVAMEVLDFDGDGDQDLICANGDNADYPPILKSYHGIRVYLNEGDLTFREAKYLPLDGAYGIRVRDFDEDGDFDIAAVSFYPDYQRDPRTAFVYFEQQENEQFIPHTFPEVLQARWMVLDAGDADGDGDIDLVLGGYDIKTSEVPESLIQTWQQADAPLMYLENRLR